MPSAGRKENEMKTFCKPELEVYTFSAADILTASSTDASSEPSTPTTDGVELPEDPLL